MSQDRTGEGRDRRVARAAVASLVLAFLAVLAAGLTLVPGRPGIAAPESGNSTAPGHVTATVCAECHADAYKAWQDSHHSWALREPTPDTVLGNFDDAAFEHKGVQSRFFRRGEKYLVETVGPDGKPAEFEIKYTVGVAPLQQYLVELDRGRLQALDIAWILKAKDGSIFTRTRNWNPETDSTGPVHTRTGRRAARNAIRRISQKAIHRRRVHTRVDGAK